jgi:hypothetical protein
MPAAVGRRHVTVRNLRAKLAGLEREISRGTNGANGMTDSYLVGRMPFLQEERDRVQAEIDELNALEGEQLNRVMCPEAFPVRNAGEQQEDDLSALARLFPKRGARPMAAPKIVSGTEALFPAGTR